MKIYMKKHTGAVKPPLLGTNSFTNSSLSIHRILGSILGWHWGAVFYHSNASRSFSQMDPVRV